MYYEGTRRPTVEDWECLNKTTSCLRASLRPLRVPLPCAQTERERKPVWEKGKQPHRDCLRPYQRPGTSSRRCETSREILFICLYRDFLFVYWHIGDAGGVLTDGGVDRWADVSGEINRKQERKKGRRREGGEEEASVYIKRSSLIARARWDDEMWGSRFLVPLLHPQLLRLRSHQQHCKSDVIKARPPKITPPTPTIHYTTHTM